MPAATQNDVKMDSAEKIAANHIKYYIEVANMPTTNDALDFLRHQDGMIVAPSKAVNAGGVGVSALEMAQNSERLVWTEQEVDQQLHRMMSPPRPPRNTAWATTWSQVPTSRASKRLPPPCTSRARSDLYSGLRIRKTAAPFARG